MSTPSKSRVGMPCDVSGMHHDRARELSKIREQEHTILILLRILLERP